MNSPQHPLTLSREQRERVEGRVRVNKMRPTGARKLLEKAAGGPLTLAMLIRAIREGEEWSLADMAGKLGVARGHVAGIENGKPVKAKTAARYASALGYSPEQFIRLSLQDEVRREGFSYRVDLSAEARE